MAITEYISYCHRAFVETPFSRLKSSKRQFYVLDDRHWRLFFYRCEEDFQCSRPPLGSIALSEAAITLTSSDDHQFVVHSEGKEHLLTAESHHAMMTWALALQTKRDAWDKMVTLGKPPEELRLTYTEAQQKALRTTTKSSVQGRKQSLQLNGGAQEALRKMVQVSWEKRRNSTLADIGLLRHSDTSKPEVENSLPTESPKRTPSPRQCDPIVEEDAKESSPETESASESDRLAAQENEDEEDENSPILRLTDNRLKSSSSSGSDVGESRLTVLQNELISIKCELAKCLNREKSCRLALEAKEMEVAKLKAERDFEKKKKELQELRSKLEMLQNRNRFLNDEIQKLSRMLQQEQFRNHSKQLNLHEMAAEVDQLKRDYVFLLQSCIRITCTDGPEMMELYMYGEKRHKQRVFTLLEEARRIDPSLPNLEGMTTSLCHVDSLGFKHMFVDKSLILHYVCRQLHRHYSTQLRSHERHLTAWKKFLRKHQNSFLQPTKENIMNILKSKAPLTGSSDSLQSFKVEFKMELILQPELKSLVRQGVPEKLRGVVWKALYRMKIRDLREAKGPKYFENLCTKDSEAEIPENHKRQISLDLLRTMPNNIHFCDRNSEGIKKLESVLHAFCLHNPNLGYCQGMNFLVGMMLLFVEAEDAFWCLVAIMERYFPSSYFDQNLIGAQADQELLKELLSEKLPKISKHLNALNVELSTVTLNWFLSIFIDSVPIETLLRIWDCFLLEGPKVLFRFCLGILYLQEEAILAKHDTVSIMRQLKAAAKLCFDVDGLISASFEELEPFPKRDELWRKREAFHNAAKRRAEQKERELSAIRERDRVMAQVEMEGNHLIECAACWGNDKVWVCHSHQHGSRVSTVIIDHNIMYRIHIEFESRVMCMHAPNNDTMLFGTYSHFVHAYHTASRKKMWEICLNECVLCLCSHQRDGVKQVFAGLADGTLAVVENVQGRMPKPEVFYVVIGSSPVTCLQLVGRRLWCACGPNVTVLSARTLDAVEQFQASSNNLDYIYRMLVGDQGVWITLRGSSILQLWDPYFLNCRLLYDIRENYSSRSSKVDEAYTNHARITSILPLDNTILVGTADGTFLVYDVIARKSPSVSASNSPQPPENPESGHAKQIQERLQKLLLEQQSSDTEGDLNTRCSNSPNLTPSSNVSRRSSASDRSSRDSIGSVGSDPGIEEEARKSPALMPPEVERSPRLQRGIRKSSFAISAPIFEEKETKLDEEEEEQTVTIKDKPLLSSAATLEPTTNQIQVVSQPPEQPKVKETQETVTQTQQSAVEEIIPELEKKRKSSDPKEFYRFRHIDAGDLASSEGGDKIVSALEFQDDSLKSAKKRYQSLSAEDIPTWVAQEKPQPVISARGDVTFEYKSKLPSIKAFIRREANELASFLKRQQQPSEDEEVPIVKSGKCPLFSIRPPTLDIADHQLHQFSSKHFPMEEPPAMEPPIESTFQLPTSRPGNASLPDSRRSSGVPEESALPPSYLASDEEFLSTAQFNDLLQLQDWTRTSRKGSDTASNISMNSAEVGFAFELHLKQMLKISDKPVKSLLKTRLINPEGSNLQEETIIVSCAGHYNDDEAVLKWTRDKSSEDQMWSNDVIIDVCPLTHTMKPSPFARARLPRRASVAATSHGSSDSSDTFGRASIESGIAKVQQILSRVSERT